MTPYDRVNELGLALMTPAVPLPDCVPYVLAGSFLSLSGQGPREPDGLVHTRKVGAEIDLEEAYGHARPTGLKLLSVTHAALGDRGRVSRVVKLLGMVNAVPSFTEYPRVINGASGLFVAVIGRVGRHARSAVGMCSLPGNNTVEIDGALESPRRRRNLFELL